MKSAPDNRNAPEITKPLISTTIAICAFAKTGVSETSKDPGLKSVKAIALKWTTATDAPNTRVAKTMFS